MSREDDLERELERIHFAPRASLGAEIRGRVARGEEPRRPPRVPRRQVLLVGATAAVLGTVLLGAWEVHRHRSVAVDRCCQDLDGGGAADDGVLIVTRAGVSVLDLRIYEDLDRSGSFTPGDPVRFFRGDAPALAGSLEGVETREYCCLDYDGGGQSDDALVVMRQPPDHITMAAIYERSAVSTPSRLR